MTNMTFRFFGLFLLVLTVSACTELPYNNLDNGQLKTLLEQGVPIYDIRRPEEWRQTGVIEGSRLLTFVDAGGRVLPDFLTRFADTVEKNDPVIMIAAPVIALARWHAIWLNKWATPRSITSAMASPNGSVMGAR
jgi:hypothetical protein